MIPVSFPPHFSSCEQCSIAPGNAAYLLGRLLALAPLPCVLLHQLVCALPIPCAVRWCALFWGEHWLLQQHPDCPRRAKQRVCYWCLGISMEEVKWLLVWRASESVGSRTAVWNGKLWLGLLLITHINPYGPYASNQSPCLISFSEILTAVFPASSVGFLFLWKEWQLTDAAGSTHCIARKRDYYSDLQEKMKCSVSAGGLISDVLK